MIVQIIARPLGMAPIATLCHRGSEPHYTSLTQDSFAAGLPEHARAVAERYPWICDYTPMLERFVSDRRRFVLQREADARLAGASSCLEPAE
jgi:hypothetical protein